ncbi:type II toxin-antitoxin system VapC family toxin [Pyrobaculum arsenaticum]|uniref:PIN domain-containing protein n=1 Tax=Pyrobaculum arsenaticum (strain DSM 13514 / JCM 11321 / PZ6) TaxID=340102 RepID=A4WHS3_PYRAR|nr:PIN domain-containing protein [Pyrobaculum arsenaticum]ABP49940.1 conserved hypothetical protein [Pyrobaculum arsenaticum DSM 13514]
MHYVETSVLASYIIASDPGHETSRKALEDIASRHKLYTSSFTLIELHNTICRKMVKEREWELVDPLQKYLDMYLKADEKCRFLLSMVIIFLEDRLGVEFLEEASIYDLVSVVPGVKMPRIFMELVELSPTLLIRVKDLLHLAYASALSNAYEIRYFLTRDVDDFERVRDVARRRLKIEIILVK